MNNSTLNAQNITEFVEKCSFTSRTHFLAPIHITIFILVAVTTFFGNILLLITFQKFSIEFKGIVYFIMKNLAFSDILLAVGLSMHLMEYIFVHLETNIVFCMIKACLAGISLSSSSKLLMFMSFDRFCAIVFPMKHLLHSTKTRRKWIKVSITWIVSILVVCVPLLLNTTRLSGSDVTFTCLIGFIVPRPVTIFYAIFIPLQFLLNIIMCLIIAWTLRNNSVARRKYKRTLKKCGIMIRVYIFFAVCWAPFVVTTILMETTGDRDKYMCIQEISLFPGCLNLSLNWVIYGLSKKKIREAFKSVLLCHSDKKLFHVPTALSSSERNTNQGDMLMVRSSSSTEDKKAQLEEIT